MNCDIRSNIFSDDSPFALGKSKFLPSVQELTHVPKQQSISVKMAWSESYSLLLLNHLFTAEDQCNNFFFFFFNKAESVCLGRSRLFIPFTSLLEQANAVIILLFFLLLLAFAACYI